MDSDFINGVKKMVAEQGKESLLDAAKAKSFLADYAMGEFKNERKRLLEILETKYQQTIATTSEFSQVGQDIVRRLVDEHFIAEPMAIEMVNLLASVLRNDDATLAPVATPVVKKKVPTPTPTPRPAPIPTPTPTPTPTTTPAKKYTGDFFALVRTGSLAEIESAIADGADVNAKKNDGGTPLHYAANQNQNPEIITALIKAGADVNAKKNNGGTPLNTAVSNNQNPEIIAALVKAGADVNDEDNGGWTPLHYAANQNQNPEIIAALVKAGADVNARGNQNPEIIAALIKAVAYVNAKANDGLTPLHYFAALGNQNPEIIAALIKAGART